MTAMVDAPQADPVAMLAEGLAGLRTGLSTLSDGEVTGRLRGVEALSRQAHAVMLDLVAETERRNLGGQEGFGSTKRMLAGILQLSRSEAGKRVSTAEQLAPRRALTGEELPAQCPATAAGLVQGQIGTAQARIITDTMARIPASTSTEDRAAAEARLAESAPHLDPAALGKLATRVLAWLDPDGPEPADDDKPAPSGQLRLRDRKHGGVGFEGWLDHEHGPAFRDLIEQFAKPRPATEGVPDPRGVEERQADALAELCGLARAADDCPEAAGEPPHLTLTMDLNMLIDRIGAASLDYGTWITAADARRWACDAKIIPAVLGSKSEPLDVGRAQRTVPAGIRRALVIRDRGCAFPGCSRPPAQCSAHHKKHVRREALEYRAGVRDPPPLG